MSHGGQAGHVFPLPASSHSSTIQHAEHPTRERTTQTVFPQAVWKCRWVSLFFLFLSPFKKKWQHWNLESGYSGRSWNWKFCLFSGFPACSHDQSLTPSLDAIASVRKKPQMISLADGLEVVESCGWWPHHWMSLPGKAPPLSAAVTCVCSHLQRCEHKQRVNAEDQRCSLFCLPLTLTHREELAVILLPPHYKPGRTIIVEKSYCH